ncbi:thermonuclease family protein [Haladaptatus pallidirubidus]|uniref:thermonuclease family protein n=1 Tax=Haladaptatus pallidirubidus TaxID=1008152 RepID=UPI001D119471|nr:thermonuclease family protein [Haladaptatus pallidirubidus]
MPTHQGVVGADRPFQALRREWRPDTRTDLGRPATGQPPSSSQQAADSADSGIRASFGGLLDAERSAAIAATVPLKMFDYFRAFGAFPVARYRASSGSHNVKINTATTTSMHRALPFLGLTLLIILAGCFGGLGLGGSDETSTTTTTPTSIATETHSQTAPVASTTTTPTEATRATTTTTETRSETRTQTTSLRQSTTADIGTPEDSERFQARILKIIDPTTLKIKHGETIQIVKLIGVNVPEDGTTQQQAIRDANSQFNQQLVTVVSDPLVSATENGHLQAYVYIGNTMVNTELIRRGYARVPDMQFSKRQEFMRKQQQAKQHGYGRWNTTTTTA